MPLIEVTVTPHGATTVETRGFVGTACQQATRELKAQLGLVVSTQFTAEYHALPAEQTPLAARPDAGS